MRLRNSGLFLIVLATIVLAFLTLFAGVPAYWMLLPVCLPLLAIVALIALIIAAAIIELVLGIVGIIVAIPIVVILAICFNVE